MLKPDYNTTPSPVDTIIFEKLVPPDHYLRRVKALLDFTLVRALMAPCYSPTLGRPAEDPLLLLKLCFLAFHYNLSDREVIEQARVNLAFRFFLDLGLQSELPDPSLLTYFRQRLGSALFRQVFEEVLRQIRAKGLVKDRLRFKDATHVIANIAVPRTIELIAQTRQRLLKVAALFAPAEVAAQHRRATEIRQTTADLKNEERLLHRVAHLREIVAWAETNKAAWLATTEAEPLNSQQAQFKRSLELAHKVLADQEPKAKDKLLSLVDPDARLGKHGDFYTGYSLDLSIDADSGIICALDVLAQGGDEAAHATELIESEEAAQGNNVESLSLDSIGFQGEVLRELTTAEDGPGLEVFVPPYTHESNNPELFQSSEFKLNETKDEVRCPGGERTQTPSSASHNQGWQFNFRKEQCDDCALRGKCLKPDNKSGRTVIKNDYEAEYAAARARAETDKYKEVRKEHPAIERKLSEMIRWHEGRRVRYRGRGRVRIQYFLTAVVVNCKRLVKLLDQSLTVQPT